MDIESYSEKYSGKSQPILGEIARVTSTSLRYDDMLSGPVVTGLLQFLINTTAASRVLEIGMFTGYATVAMAGALPPGGKVVTCESNKKYIDLALPLIKQSGLENRIEIIFGDAMKTLDSIVPWFDLVFLDADKENYLNYFEKALPLLKKDGIFVIDNAFWQGKVNDPGDRKGAAVHSLNERIQLDNNLENVMLPVRDGLHLVLKKSD
jgi:caffeoyl-CoA O-methyltransferase